MSTKITRDIELTPEAVEVTDTLSGDTVAAPDHCIELEPLDSIITGSKNEYTIVGDALYATVNVEAAPTWLTTLVDSVVTNQIAAGFVDYDNLAQDVQNAVASIDIASNNYVTKVQYDVDQAGIVNSVVSQLDATYDLTGIQSTVTNIDVVVANELVSQGIVIQDIETAYKGYTDGQITSINNSLSTAIGSYASSINALTVAYSDPDTGLLATASAVESLNTYVGLDDNGDPNSLGMLADISVLKKQADGSIDVYAGTHDVITGTDTGTVDDDSMVLTEWPYALWTPMEDAVDLSLTGGVPTMTQRTVDKDGTPTSFPIESNTVYKNTFVPASPTYWLFDSTLGTWDPIDLLQYNDYIVTVRDRHKGDSYIKYSEDIYGTKTYDAAFKFVLVAVDVTPPYSTDPEGYAWVKVVDTDAQAAYITALNAYALADGKVSVYFALESGTNPGSLTYAYYYDPTPVDGTNLRKTSDSTVVTPEEGDQVTVKSLDGAGEDIYLYFFKGGIWVVGTPNGVVAGAKWSIDLDAYLGGNDGNGVWGGSSLLTNTVETTSKGEIQAAFEYDAELISKTGQYYRSGFGLTASAGTGTQGDPFTSEFWVQADKFKVVPAGESQPDAAGPIFTVDAVTGDIIIGTDRTEATLGATWGTDIDNLPTSLNDISASEFDVIASQDSSSQISGNLIVNGNMRQVAIDGRPVGVKAVYGGTDPSVITYLDAGKTVLKLYDASDTSIGVGWPAFPVNPNTTYRVIIRIKSSAAVGSGFYLRAAELDSDLPDGITHISGNTVGEVGYVSPTRQLTSMAENLPLTTSYQTFEYTYAPTSSAKWASLFVLNWTGAGTAAFHIDRVVAYPNADVTEDTINGPGVDVSDNGGAIRSGKTGYTDTGAGWWIGRDAGVGKLHFGNSADYLKWDGSTLSLSGNLVAATGTFSGDLSAAGGTFSGSLSAASGSFTGSLTAASGTFSGTLTASAINAVNTINIAGNAVTVPLFVRSDGTHNATTSWVTTLSGSVASEGQPVLIDFNCSAYTSGWGTGEQAGQLGSVSARILRGATVLYTKLLHSSVSNGDANESAGFRFQDNGATGTHTYYIQILKNNNGAAGSVSYRNLLLLGVKR